MRLVLSLLAASAVALLAHGAFQTRPEASPNAREFVGSEWLNVSGRPPTLANRHGKPTLVAFWTFGCSNCQANLPPYARLYEKYKTKGIELVAIHTPETSGERKRDAVVEHIERFGIRYPVLIDNDNKNWDRWKVQYWPTLFVLDGEGRVRYRWEGELGYGGGDGEAKIAGILDRLLAEK